MKSKLIQLVFTLLCTLMLSAFLHEATAVAGFSDEFNTSTLNPNWTWIDPNADCTYNLTANPSYLRISVPHSGNDLWIGTNYDAPRMIQPVNGDFLIETRVLFDPQHDAQGAGILVWKDSDNYLRLDRLVDGDGSQVDVSGENGSSWSKYAHTPYSLAETYLRLVRIGNTFNASYSNNGTSWNFLYEVSLPFTDPVSIGLFVLDEWQDNPTYADFDYFRMGNLPFVGGIQIPVDKLVLATPYVGLAVGIAAILSSSAYARKRKLRRSP